MILRWILGTACILLLILAVIRAFLRLHFERRASARGRTAAGGYKKADACRVRRIDEVEFGRMCLAEPEITVFHLADDHRAEAAIDLPGELIVTWAQLEEAVRWTPLGSRIVVYRAQEIDDRLIRRLTMFTQRHEVLLLCGRSARVEEQLRRA